MRLFLILGLCFSLFACDSSPPTQSIGSNHSSVAEVQASKPTFSFTKEQFISNYNAITRETPSFSIKPEHLRQVNGVTIAEVRPGCTANIGVAADGKVTDITTFHSMASGQNSMCMVWNSLISGAANKPLSTQQRGAVIMALMEETIQAPDTAKMLDAGDVHYEAVFKPGLKHWLCGITCRK